MVEWSVPNSLANWDALEILTGKISKTYHRVIQEFAKTTILMDETSVRGADVLRVWFFHWLLFFSLGHFPCYLLQVGVKIWVWVNTVYL